MFVNHPETAVLKGSIQTKTFFPFLIMLNSSLFGGSLFAPLIKQSRPVHGWILCVVFTIIILLLFTEPCECHQPHLRASRDLMEVSLWCCSAPSQGRRLGLGCSRTPPAASRSYNRLRQKKGKTFIWLYTFPINLLLKWMNKLNSPFFFFFFFFAPAVFIMQYARQWDAFKWDRVKDYCSRRGTTYITIISNTAVQFHNDKYEVSELHHR